MSNLSIIKKSINICFYIVILISFIPLLLISAIVGLLVGLLAGVIVGPAIVATNTICNTVELMEDFLDSIYV